MQDGLTDHTGIAALLLLVYWPLFLLPSLFGPSHAPRALVAKALAADRQVLVITHLPQIAVFAEAHWRVTKTVEGDRTVVSIDRLTEKQRVAEISRMLSGAASKQATAHADEMLRRARA